MLTIVRRVRFFKVGSLKLSLSGSRGYVAHLKSARCEAKPSLSYSEALIQWLDELKANSPVIVRHVHLGSRLHVLLRHGRRWVNSHSPRSSCATQRVCMSNTQRVCMSLTPYVFNDCTVVDEPQEATDEHVTVHNLSVQHLKTLLDMGYPMTSLDQLLDLFGVAQNFTQPYSYTGDDLTRLEGNLSRLHTSSTDALNACRAVSTDVTRTQDDVAKVCIGSFYDDDIICRDSYHVDVSGRSAAMENTGYDVLYHAMSEETCRDNAVGLPMLTTPFSDNTNLLQCSTPTGSPNGSKPVEGHNEKPNQDALTVIQEHMANYLPTLFNKGHNYRIYRQDVIFENNFSIKSKTTVGLTSYAIEVAKLRMFAHFKYANVRLQVMKITTHLEDGTVRVHWRVSGISQKRAFMFWKFLPWFYRKSMSKESEWTEGISTLYVAGEDGLITKHKLDRVIPDTDAELKLAEDKKIAAKLGLAAS